MSSSKQIWRDLIGYYTRFGDVRELLEKIDDRYVIMNAGDEMSLRFPEQPPPPAGWVRDYVFMGDGWIKDGDYNSTFSKTVLPLPYHAKQEYTTPPGKLEDEWVYKQYPEDWQKYHTRYVTPEVFQNALRSGRDTDDSRSSCKNPACRYLRRAAGYAACAQTSGGAARSRQVETGSQPGVEPATVFIFRKWPRPQA